MDNFTVIFTVFISAMLMLVFPLMSISEKTDNISQLVVETATTEFVDDVRRTGKLTNDKYENFSSQLASTGNTYQIDMKAQILDENPGIKTTQAERTKIGENVYYTIYTSQIEDALRNSTNGEITLKEGDIFSASVQNTNTTIAQSLRNFFYRIRGNNTYQIAAQDAGMVSVNGTK